MNFLKKREDVKSTEKDSLGGFVVDTGVYGATIKHVYMTQADSSDAVAINFEFELSTGAKYKEQIWITNKQGDNTYIDKNSKELKYLPGFEMASAIAVCANGLELDEQDVESKMVNIYNAELKKEVPTEVPVFVSLIGAELQVGIHKVRTFKQEKNSAGVYVDTTETRELNSIHKTFTSSGFTVTEMKAEAEAPEFIEKYKEEFKSDYVKDKTKNAKDAKKSAAPNGMKSATKSLLKPKGE